MTAIRQLPVAVPLPSDWDEQVARRRQEDTDEALERRARELAGRCPWFLSKRRHNLVADDRPTHMHRDGELDVFTVHRCTGLIRQVGPTGVNHLRCPVFEVDGQRYPTRAPRLRMKPHRKRLLYRATR